MRNSKLALAGALALVSTFFVSTAALADDPMATTYGNTVTTKDMKTGAVGTLLFNQDGSYTANGTGPDGKAVSYGGTWTTKDGGATLCLTPSMANATANCSPLASHAVGEHWTVSSTNGQSFDVVVTAGR
jgi:hypothetical protein